MLSDMSGITVERAKEAWALLVDVPALNPHQVVVRAKLSAVSSWPDRHSRIG
jgi:hypothetical protein